MLQKGVDVFVYLNHTWLFNNSYFYFNKSQTDYRHAVIALTNLKADFSFCK